MNSGDLLRSSKQVDVSKKLLFISTWVAHKWWALQRWKMSKIQANF